MSAVLDAGARIAASFDSFKQAATAWLSADQLDRVEGCHRCSPSNLVEYTCCIDTRGFLMISIIDRFLKKFFLVGGSQAASLINSILIFFYLPIMYFLDLLLLHFFHSF